MIYIKKFIEWLKNIHSSGTSESAKRLYGGIGYICSIVFIAIWRRDLIDTLLFISSALLGLETILRKFKKKE